MNDAQQQRETGRRLFQAGNFAQAIAPLKSAVEAFPTEELLWQELVLAASKGGQHEEAVDFATRAVVQHPRSDWLWRQLGSELTFVDRLEEAETALDNSRSLNPNEAFLWRYYAALHRKRKNLDGEIEALQRLVKLDEANSTDLNQLGIAYHDHKNFAKALDFYRLSAATEPSVAPLFNMGLVFNDPEVSQDLDAADAYHRALAINPNYERARERLEVTKKKLGPLAESARAVAPHLLQADDFFRFYMSPFELLQIDAVETAQDARAIQRAKNRLLQEIELNDCKVPWLDNHPLDRSRALAVVDELDDKTRRRFHAAIFTNKPLLRFLTRGEIDHFLYSDAYIPQEALEHLEEEPTFVSFLSKPFAQQYNRVLTRAVEQRLFPVVEVLFDGRRWVEPEDDDVCFGGILKRVKALLEQMEEMVALSTKTKITSSKVEEFLSHHSIPEFFNLLPTAFRGEQTRLVEAIRQLAIACHNAHKDSEGSAKILDLCKRLQFKDVGLTKRLEEDTKAIQTILKDKSIEVVFRNLKPIKSAPSLYTVNGMGFALYGRADYDSNSDSYIATHYFVVLSVPVFPIARYRVSPTEGGYRFFGKAPWTKSTWWHLFLFLVLSCFAGYWIVASNENHPNRSSTSTSLHRDSFTPSRPASPEPRPSLASLASEIEGGKRRAALLESQMRDMDSRLEDHKRKMDSYTNAGMIDQYNDLVSTFNALVKQRNQVYEEYDRLIDDVNSKVRRYNAGNR